MRGNNDKLTRGTSGGSSSKNNNNNNVSHSNNGPRGGGGQQRRSSSHSTNRRPSNFNTLPIEQGIVCSLKESFGFIHCAERPEEIFFHFSEVTNCRPEELQIDTEVEFKVGTSPVPGNGGGGGGGRGGDGDDGNGPAMKLSAYQIKPLPTGTVLWETEEEEGRVYQGLVEKAPRNDSGGRGGSGGKPYDTDGSIRILPPNFTLDAQKDNEDLGEGTKNKAPLVRLRAGEYSSSIASPDGTGDNSLPTGGGGGSTNRLYRGDLIEFRILIDRRTKQKYARYIKLLQTEKERSRIEREKQLLESAVPEEGIIVSLNKGFGFLKSNKRRDDIYFHYSHVILPETDENGNDGPEQEEFELKIGQEVKFLVVVESQSEGEGGVEQQKSNKQYKCSARQIVCVPEGSVVFHTVIARGVKGMVTLAPQPPSPGNKGDDSREGKIRIFEPLKDTTVAGESDEKLIEDVLVHYSDSPGGVFTYQNHRNQLVAGLWVHEGDTLMFDVTKETVDGSYRAIPTIHKLAVGGEIEEPKPKSDNKSSENNGIQQTDDLGVQPAIRMVSPTMVGRAEGTIHALKSDYGFIHFAERPIDVHFKMYDFFPDEIQDDIRRQMGIEGPVTFEVDAGIQFDICAHGNISSAGSGNRGRPGKGGNAHERENVRGQRIVLLPKSAVTVEKVVASGVKGVIKAVDSKQVYAGLLELDEDIKSMTLDQRHPLVARMLDSFLEESSTPSGRKTLVYRDTLSIRDDDIVIEMAKLKGGGILECTHIPIPGINPHPGRLCIRRVEKSADSAETNVEEIANNGKRAKSENKQFKQIRFDKSSMVNDLKEDVPPGIGDILSLDVVYSRRSGNMKAVNMKIVERKAVEVGKSTKVTKGESSGIGIVKEIVPKRSFGFISVLDNNAARMELLFFHIPKDRKGGGIRRGDEVKFDIVMEGSKRIATNIKTMPTGTVPSSPSKNACFGYVLLEPSHTSLENTPVRKAHSNLSADKSSNGRWAESKEDPKKNPPQDLHEEGCILLLEDKTGMFQKKSNRRRRKRNETGEGGVDSSDDISVDDARSIDSVGDNEASGDEDMSSDDSADDDRNVTIFSHVGYRNGAIAIHGSGSALSMDGSSNPRRGDLVSFVKGRKRGTVRDIRVVDRHKATLLRGRLEKIELSDNNEGGRSKGKAKFIASTQKEEQYDVALSEVVSCDVKILKEKESVEGILHDGRIFGICRTCDLYLTSKLGTTHKERPKLNLTVKKTLGGTIMAQSMMAKGPDGSIGFQNGWTKRSSPYVVRGDETNSSWYTSLE